MTRGNVPLAILAGVSATLKNRKFRFWNGATPKNQKISNLGARKTPKNQDSPFLGARETPKNKESSNLGARETPKKKEIKFLGAVGDA